MTVWLIVVLITLTLLALRFLPHVFVLVVVVGGGALLVGALRQMNDVALFCLVSAVCFYVGVGRLGAWIRTRGRR